MKKSLLSLWAVAAVASLVLPARAQAQMAFSVDEAEGEAPEEGSAEQSAEGEGDVFSNLAGTEEGAEAAEERGPRPTETVEEIYAVQQIYALRLHRWEIAPSAAFNMNDPFLSHPGVGLAVNYW